MNHNVLSSVISMGTIMCPDSIFVSVSFLLQHDNDEKKDGEDGEDD